MDEPSPNPYQSPVEPAPPQQPGWRAMFKNRTVQFRLLATAPLVFMAVKTYGDGNTTTALMTVGLVLVALAGIVQSFNYTSRQNPHGTSAGSGQKSSG